MMRERITAIISSVSLDETLREQPLQFIYCILDVFRDMESRRRRRVSGRGKREHVLAAPARLVGGTQNGDVQVFDLEWLANELSEGRNPKNLRALKILLGHQKPVSSIAFFPTGKQIVTAAAEHNAIVWDVASGETIATLRGGPGESYVSVAVLDAGYRIAGGLTNGHIRLWEAI